MKVILSRIIKKNLAAFPSHLAVSESMTFSDRLKQIRVERHLTRTALAEQLGVSYQTISQWEGGSTHPRGWRLERIAEALKTTVGNLMADEPGPSSTSPDALPPPGHEDFLTSAVAGHGERLQAIRLALRYSIEEFASRIGVPTEQYHAWERELEIPDLLGLALLKERGGVSIDYMLFGDPEALSPNLARKLVAIGIGRNAPDAARDIRQYIVDTPERGKATLHETPAGLSRTIRPKRGS